MESLDDFLVAPEETESLDAFDFGNEQATKPLPDSALNNRAAVMSAIDNSGRDVIDTYTTLRQDMDLSLSAREDQIAEEARARVRESVYKNGVMPILEDSSLDLGTKQAVMDSFFHGDVDADSLTVLASDSLIAPSDGETLDADEARQAVGPNLMTSFRQSYVQEQQIANTFALDAQKRSSLLSEAAGTAQMFIPTEEGISAYRFLNELNARLGTTEFSPLKGFFTPGGSMLEVKEKYLSLGSEERLALLETVADVIKDTNGVILSTDSQYSAMRTMDKIIGNYDTSDATWDTLFNALDIIGVAWAVKGIKSARRASKIGEAGEPIAEASQSLPAGFTPPKDIVAKAAHPEKAKLDVLYDQQAKLLGDASQVLPPKSVASLTEELAQIDKGIDSLSDAFREQVKSLQVRKGMTRGKAEAEVKRGLDGQRKSLEARKERVGNMLEQNAAGQKAQDKLSAIQNEINRIEKLPDADGIIRVNPIVDAINRADRNAIIGIENTASVGSILMRTNPSKARNAVMAAWADETGKVAEAMFGTSRQDALANAFMPKHLTPTGTVPARPVDVMKMVNNEGESLLDSVKGIVRDKGGVEFTERELEDAANKIMNDFSNPTGIKVFDGMDGFYFDADTGAVKVSSMYGSKGGAFSDAQEALDSVRISLKNYGDVYHNAKLMRKEGTNYVETTLAAEKGKKGNYLVKVELEKPITLADVKAAGPLDQFKVRLNMLDTIGGLVSEKHGSLTRHIFNTSSMFDKHLTKAASVGDVLSNRLEKVLQRKVRNITKMLKELPEGRRNELTAYFVEANNDGIALSRPDFARRGFTEKQFEIASEWREYWDSVFYLQDKDVKATLSNSGYMLLDNGSDRLFARPIEKNITKSTGYDPTTGEVVTLSRIEMDELYNKGGTLATTKTPMKIDGQDVENLIVRNTPDSFLRAFGDGDRVLNYREGYYTTSYRAPLFIDKIDPKTGKATAIATALDRTEANAFIKRAAKENPEFSYKARPDKKTLPDQKEDVWSLEEQAGRSAQKRRGKPLIEADGSNRLEGTAYFDGPFESAVRASRSVAGRAMYREIIATAKERAMQKHADVFPTDRLTRMKKFPATVGDISSREGPYTKAAREARSDFEYIHFLENGYINGLDNLWKQILGATAEGLGMAAEKSGVKGLTLAERAARATANAPVTGLAKFFVFNAYIASAVFRQWLVQPSQVLRMFSYSPTSFLNANTHLAKYGYDLVAGVAEKAPKGSFTAFVERSGFLDSVDKSNLVRGTLTTAGEQRNVWERTGGRLFNPLRKAGYDLGEKANLLGHMATVYDQYKRQGKNMASLKVQQEMISKVDALSYQMRFSGDMPYNQNFLSAFVQFLQVPHKAVLQVTDRRLTAAEKMRLIPGDILLYAGGSTLVTEIANALFGEELLDEHPEAKKIIQEGALQYAANAALEQAFGEDPNLDFKGTFSPYEFGGYAKMFSGLLQDGGLMALWGGSPIGNVTDTRVVKAMASVSRLMGWSPDSEIAPTDVMEVLGDLAEITSGYSHLQKAAVAWNTQKILTKSGQVLVDGVSPVQAVAQAFGISPMEVSNYYEHSIELGENKKAYKDKVVNDVRTIIKVAANKTGLGVQDARTREIVNSILMQEYKNSPQALRIINQEMRFALEDPNQELLNAAFEAAAFPEMETDKELLKSILPKDQISTIDRWYNDLANSNKGEDEWLNLE